MDADLIRTKRDEVARRYGAWTAHNIHLADDVYTIVSGIEGGNEFRLRRVIQTVADLAGRPFDQLRVLDLGCLEGLFAVELARRGAHVVGVEGREANIAKARFAKDVLGLDTLELVQDDIRNVSRERYGEFDVVLCLGVLYHFDTPTVFDVLGRVGHVCRSFAVIETHISTTSRKRFPYGGAVYWGSTLDEPRSSVDEHDRRLLWSSIGNQQSVLLTRPSLCNALVHSGFTSVLESHMPFEGASSPDWTTLVAIKGARQDLVSAPLLDTAGARDLPEETLVRLTGKHLRVLFRQHVWYQSTNSRAYYALRRVLPDGIRHTLARFVS